MTECFIMNIIRDLERLGNLAQVSGDTLLYLRQATHRMAQRVYQEERRRVREKPHHFIPTDRSTEGA